MTTAGSIFVAPVADADEGCFGDYCSGKNAYDMGCDSDAYAWGTVNVYEPTTNSKSKVGTLKLMVSKKCGTRWAFLDLNEETGVIKLSTKQEGGYTQEQAKISGAGTYYTMMTYSRDKCSQAMVSGRGINSAETGCAIF